MGNTEITIIGLLITALSWLAGVFLKGTIMLKSDHKDQMADKDKQIADERRRTERAEYRAEQLLSYGMKVAGVSEGLITASKNKDDREYREREGQR